MKTGILILIIITLAGSAFAESFFQRDLPPVPDPMETWKITDMVAGDVGNDGSNELVVAWTDAPTATLHVVVTYRWYAGDLKEVARVDLASNQGVSWVFLEDTDTDGHLELIIVESWGDGGSPLTIHEWNGSGWDPDWSQAFSTIRRSNTVAVGDVDGDLFNEIVVTVDWYSRELSVIDYDEVGMTYTVAHNVTGNDFRSADIGDVNGDGQLDIVAGCGNWSYFDGRVYSWDGAQYSLLWDSPDLGNVSATSVDHDGNGVEDVVLANWASPHVSGQNGLHFYAWGGGTFNFQYTLSPDIPLVAPKPLDFDNDGIEDLVAVAIEQDEPGAFFGDGLHFYKRSGTQFVDYEVLEGIIGTQPATVDGCDLDNDGFNELIMAFADTDFGDTGYWFQHVMDFPIITKISDIPLDDGRQVRIRWGRAAADDGLASDYVQDYRVWRKVKDGLKGVGAEVMATANGDLFELVGETPAMNWNEYALVVPTLADEGEVTDPMFDFMVTAHMADGRNHYSSPVQSGFSIDQTAPSAPENLQGVFEPYSVSLTWDPVSAGDFSHYEIYRVSSEVESYLGNSSTNSFDDDSTQFDVMNVSYRVSARDWAGNESEKTEIEAPQISGTPGTDLIPVLAASLSAYPNPFNPQTTVKFVVPESDRVRISVYDLSGRRVRNLIDSRYSQGTFEATWDGRDQNGRTVSAGTYVLNMVSGNHQKSYRVAMVK